MILIENGKLISMADDNDAENTFGNSFGEKTIENGYVVIRKDKIIYAGYDEVKVKEIFSSNNKDKSIIIDAGGGYIFPGMIDAHCHIGLFDEGESEEGKDGNESTDAITPHLRAIDGIYHDDRSFEDAYKAGITTVVTGPGSANVIGGQFAALKTFGRCVDEMILKTPVAMKFAFGENPKKEYANSKKMPKTRMGTAAILRETLVKAVNYCSNSSRMEFDIKLNELEKVITGALPVKIHAHRTDDILTAIRIANEFNLNFTIEHCSEGHLIKDLLKEKNIKVIVGPLMLNREKPELRNIDIKMPGILEKAGIDIAIMSDHPCIPVQDLMISVQKAYKEGLSAKMALKSVTVNAAEFCGISDRVGSIEPGKDADIVIFDKHPLDFYSEVKYTIINGKVVYQK